MRAAVQSQQGQAASGKAEEEPIVVLSATAAYPTTPPVAAWAPIRAAGELRDTS